MFAYVHYKLVSDQKIGEIMILYISIFIKEQLIKVNTTRENNDCIERRIILTI